MAEYTIQQAQAEISTLLNSLNGEQNRKSLLEEVAALNAGSVYGKFKEKYGTDIANRLTGFYAGTLLQLASANGVDDDFLAPTYLNDPEASAEEIGATIINIASNSFNHGNNRNVMEITIPEGKKQGNALTVNGASAYISAYLSALYTDSLPFKISTDYVVDGQLSYVDDAQRGYVLGQSSGCFAPLPESFANKGSLQDCALAGLLEGNLRRQAPFAVSEAGAENMIVPGQTPAEVAQTAKAATRAAIPQN